jgi:hypothetical protein
MEDENQQIQTMRTRDEGLQMSMKKFWKFW